MSKFDTDLTGLLENDPLDHECTSWMVFADKTAGNCNILHKNRDSQTLYSSVYLSPENSPRKWIGSGTLPGVNMGMNSSGLAGVMNSGEEYLDPPTDPTKRSTPKIFREILDTCDTAAQAVEKLREIIASGDYWHKKSGSIFFLMDRNEGFVCEFTSRFFTVQPYKDGYTVRANIWQNPHMQEQSRIPISKYLNSAARACIAFSGLNKILDEKGKISLLDIFDLSRHCKTPEESSEKRSLCCFKTNSTASLEVDRQYPAVLSTGYFTIGYPRNTVYVTVPICAGELPVGMTDETWSRASRKRYDEQGFDAPMPESWLKYESDFMAKYTAAKESARKLLDEGKEADAVKLLNDTAASIWREAEEILGLNA